MKTMAIRVDDEVHAQFVILSQLDGVSLTDELKLALEGHVARRRSEPGFAEKAQAVLEEIDKEAAARRTAIQSLFAEGTTEPEPRGGDASDQRPEGQEAAGASAPRGWRGRFLAALPPAPHGSRLALDIASKISERLPFPILVYIAIRAGRRVDFTQHPGIMGVRRNATCHQRGTPNSVKPSAKHVKPRASASGSLAMSGVDYVLGDLEDGSGEFARPTR